MKNGKQFATLIKWSDNNSTSSISSKGSSKAKTNRVVCGQDPRYCRNPKSVHPFEWDKAEISQWPICEESVPQSLIPKSAKHMHCEITGRPCCIQMHGQCRITTKDYCNFVRATTIQRHSVLSSVLPQ
uniref:Uncharacterized protein n=1 Tax=Ditylenchus dipsaci TaxID=166011 RepID=A0A915DPM8_9BILA